MGYVIVLALSIIAILTFWWNRSPTNSEKKTVKLTEEEEAANDLEILRARLGREMAGKIEFTFRNGEIWVTQPGTVAAPRFTVPAGIDGHALVDVMCRIYVGEITGSPVTYDFLGTDLYLSDPGPSNARMHTGSFALTVPREAQKEIHALILATRNAAYA